MSRNLLFRSRPDFTREDRFHIQDISVGHGKSASSVKGIRISRRSQLQSGNIRIKSDCLEMNPSLGVLNVFFGTF